MANTGPASNTELDDLFEKHYGADIFNELFGDPENPGTLLWMANGIYHTAETVLTCLASPFSACKKLKPE